MRRKITLMFFVLIIFMSSCNKTNKPSAGVDHLISYRDIPGVTEDEILAIEKVKAGTDNLTFGHLLEMESISQSDGSNVGFTTMFCKLLSELFGIEVRQIAYEDWQEMKNDVDSHLIDFTGDLTPNSVRMHTYYMTEPIADRAQKIIFLKDVNIDNEDDVNGLKLGFLENSINIEPILRRYPDITFETIYLESITSVEKMLENGEIDAFVTERNVEAFFYKDDRIQIKRFFPLAYTSVSLTTANPDLTAFISVINKYEAAGGTDVLHSLYKESEYEYTKQVLFNSFTEEELTYLNRLAERGEPVYIALENDNYPLSFYNEVEKSFQGVVVDLLDEIGMLTGIRFVNTTTKDSTWPDILTSLKTKKVSIVSRLGYIKARENYALWSDISYKDNHFAFISKEDFPKTESYQIPRLRVGVITDTIYEEMYKEWFPDAKNLFTYPTQNETLNALEKDEVDLIFGTENMLLAQTNYREKSGYKINHSFSKSTPSYLGFNHDEIILRDILDKAQRHIDLDSIRSYWSNRVFDYSKVISRMQTLYLSIFSVGILIALLTTLLMFIKNNRLSKKLAKHAATLTTIYDAIPDLVFSKDTNNAYTSCNLSFEQYAGMTESELIGKTDMDVFFPHEKEMAAIHMEDDRRIMSGDAVETVEETLTYPDHTKRLMETIKVPLVENGKTTGILGIARDVTERKEVKSRLDSIINTAQIVFMLSVDGIVMEANDYARHHIGAKIGEKMRTYYTDPDQRKTIVKQIESEGAVSNVVVGFYTANGEKHRFLTSFTAVMYEQRKAYFFWALDIEKTEQEGEQLFASQQSFQTVLDILPMPVRIVDLESGEIVYVNDRLLALLEFDTVNELYGLPIEKLLPEVLSDGTQAAERVKTMLTVVDFVSIEVEYLTKNGKTIEAVVVTRHVDYKGRPSSIGIIRDLTAEKERERILREAAEREKIANQSKTLFLANMSHEIRTPMNGVIGMTDLLMGEPLTARQMQYVKDIKMSAASLLDIINDILDLSKIAEGRLQISLVDIDLSLLLKNIVSMMSFSAHSKGLKFIDDMQINMPEYVRVDDVRVKQILVNLLSNAIKFTKEGYVKLTVNIQDDQILFAVSDTGIGIKQDELQSIFLAFEQADKRKNRSIKGTGLGLSISKNLAELMGGSVSVESEYGTGTTFYLSIPYVRGDESVVESPDTLFEYIFAPTAQVLLVDDIQTNLTVGAGLLRHCKIIADVAICGHEAIKLVTSKDYDLILMDHMMPEMDGIETTMIIREMGEKYKNLPIIALTANAVNESKELLLSSGMNDFMSKPIDKAVLMNMLMKWLPPQKIEIGGKQDNEATAPYSKLLEEATGIDGLDIALALNRIGGLQSVLETSIRQVAYSISDRVKNMDASLASGDLKSFAIDAHGLKGAFANIGAMNNSELAAGLEIAAKADNKPLCLELFSSFPDIMEDFANELKSVFTQPQEQDKVGGDGEFLIDNINKAIDSLNKFEAGDALMSINTLMAYTFGKETDELLNEAKNLINVFKYKKAVNVLKSIC